MPLDEIFDRASRVAPRRIILLDACRNDPFTNVIADPSHPVSLGLGRVGQSDGAVYAFATAPGKTASDGTGENSPFTEALVKHFRKPGLELRSLLTLVQMEVYERTYVANCTRDPAPLEESIDAYNAALEKIPRERWPFNWGLIQFGLAQSLSGLGQEFSHYRAALQEITPERAAQYWAEAQFELGSDLTLLGSQDTGVARFKEALLAFRSLEGYLAPDLVKSLVGDLEKRIRQRERADVGAPPHQ